MRGSSVVLRFALALLVVACAAVRDVDVSADGALYPADGGGAGGAAVVTARRRAAEP